jgi:hypothetical protein
LGRPVAAAGMFLSDISVFSNLLRSNLLGGGHCTGVSETPFKKKLKQRVKASWDLLASPRSL